MHQGASYRSREQRAVCPPRKGARTPARTGTPTGSRSPARRRTSPRGRTPPPGMRPSWRPAARSSCTSRARRAPGRSHGTGGRACNSPSSWLRPWCRARRSAGAPPGGGCQLKVRSAPERARGTASLFTGFHVFVRAPIAPRGLIHGVQAPEMSLKAYAIPVTFKAPSRGGRRPTVGGAPQGSLP